LFVYYKAASAHDHKLKVINDTMLLCAAGLDIDSFTASLFVALSKSLLFVNLTVF